MGGIRLEPFPNNSRQPPLDHYNYASKGFEGIVLAANGEWFGAPASTGLRARQSGSRNIEKRIIISRAYNILTNRIITKKEYIFHVVEVWILKLTPSFSKVKKIR